MTSVTERPPEALPSREDTELARKASLTLSQRADRQLKARLDDGSELVLPKAATRLLSHILTEMALGNAVTIIPLHAELTTGEAADLLHVSRPHLIKLLETGAIHFHRVGTHRRIRFSDLQSYDRRVRKEREAAMQELADQAQELGFGY